MKTENNTRSLDMKKRLSKVSLDLTSMYVKKQQGQLIQMDNIISIEEQSKPPQLYHNNRYLSAMVSPWQSINDGIEAMNEIKTKVLIRSLLI
jgi:multidrug efflux pump subunit AcrB